MGKKTYTVQWTPDITVTAGNGSISVADTKTGGTDTTTTTVYPYTDNFKTVVSYEMPDHLEGYGFNESKMEYKFTDDFKEALKKVIKETVLEEVVYDSEKEVKAIPIEWIKNWFNPKYANTVYYSLLRDMIKDWEKENETN